MNMLASNTIEFLEKSSRERTAILTQIYSEGYENRLSIYIGALKKFIELFGDKPVSIVRAPGRVNLRGMHIDTHGGFLNLVTLNREVIVVASPSEDGWINIHNVNPTYKPLKSSIETLLTQFGECKKDNSDDKKQLTKEYSSLSEDAGDHWHKYIIGTFIQFYNETQKSNLKGINAVVCGDIPEGCSLSSSHALCISILLAIETLNSISIDTLTKIRLVQKAEWFAGARSGLSDQIAELLCKKGHLLGVQINPITAEILEKEYISIPEEVSIVVANSNQKRDISSTHSGEYVKNRFAYSVAIELLKKALLDYGFNETELPTFNTFQDFTSNKIGGANVLYQMFKKLPLTMSTEELGSVVGQERLEELCRIYFGHLSEENKPKTVNIRGAIVYGICEHLRARAFFDAMKNGDLVLAGYLMSQGHNGDRIIDSHGYPYKRTVTDDILYVYNDLRIDPFTLPGDYGASTPVLDRMVDVAIQAGALGASLTGAGLGGAIVSLCLKENVNDVIEALQKWLGSEEYIQLSGRAYPLTSEEIKKSVFENTTSQASGIITIPEVMTIC